MDLRSSLVVDAPPAAVFALVSDPRRYGQFFAGVTRWDHRGGRRRGTGATYKILMKVGSIEAGGLVRISEWRANRLIAWEAERGIDQRGRWELRPLDGATELSLHIEAHLVGPASGVVDRLAARVIARNMEATLLAARRLVEQEHGGPGGGRPERGPGRDGAAEAAGSTASIGRGALGRLRAEASRLLEAVHPKTVATLHRAGVLDLGAALGGVGAAPWYLGRGPSLGFVSQLNAIALGRKEAIRDRAGSLTWRDLDGRANRLTRVFESLDVHPGDTVAILLRNGRELVESLIAAQKIGVVAAPLNTWAKPAELRAVLGQADPTLLVFDALHAKQVRAAAPKGLATLVVGGGPPGLAGALPYEAAMEQFSPAPPPPFTIDRGRPRVLIHTSGTTGTPKGAARDTGGLGLAEFVGLLDVVPLRREDVFLVPAPMFHSFGLLSLSTGALLGATFVLPERFEPEETLRLIEEHRVTAASLVPVMIHRIVSLPEPVKRRYDVSSLRVLLASGSALPEDLRDKVERLFPEALYDLYGSTEAGWVAIAGPTDMASHPGTVGRPVWGVEVAVYSPEGRRLGPGETGELYVRSGATFEGYTSGEQKHHRDGHVALGDLGSLDEDGYLYVAGRVDDMVVIGGENVYPAEVEEVIRAVRGVTDVAVVGAPDPEFGHVLAAFVVGSASPEAVVAACRDELASFKVPRHVRIVDELPRTSTGKVLKRELLPRRSKH